MKASEFKDLPGDYARAHRAGMTSLRHCDKVRVTRLGLQCSRRFCRSILPEGSTKCCPGYKPGPVAVSMGQWSVWANGARTTVPQEYAYPLNQIRGPWAAAEADRVEFERNKAEWAEADARKAREVERERRDRAVAAIPGHEAALAVRLDALRRYHAVGTTEDLAAVLEHASNLAAAAEGILAGRRANAERIAGAVESMKAKAS